MEVRWLEKVGGQALNTFDRTVPSKGGHGAGQVGAGDRSGDRPRGRNLARTAPKASEPWTSRRVGMMLLHTNRCTIQLVLVRKQIIVPSETDKRIRRLARQKGISQSALIVEAVEALPESSTQVDQVLAFAGIIKGAPPTLSEEVDEVVYR